MQSNIAMSMCAPAPVRSRAKSAAPMAPNVNVPVRQSAIASPAMVGGPSGKPVTLISPRHGLDDRVVGALPAVGPGAAEPRDRRQDDARVDLPQRLVADAVALERAGAEVLHHHVGAPHDLEEQLAVGVRLDVERDALLAAVDGGEEHALSGEQRRPAARHVAGRRALDLHHARAELGEQQGAERTGKRMREVGDENAGERTAAGAVGLRGHDRVPRAKRSLAVVRRPFPAPPKRKTENGKRTTGSS